MELEEQYDKIYRFCYYRTLNRETAEDLTQETYLRFLKSNYQERGIGIRYLYTIARNLCIEEARKQKSDSLSEDLSDGGKEAEDIVEIIRVRQALEKLPDEDRDLIIMRFVNEESVKDICMFTGLSRFALYRKLKSFLNGKTSLKTNSISDINDFFQMPSDPKVAGILSAYEAGTFAGGGLI